MNAAADDWRRMAQERFLPPGTALTRRPYEPSRPHWEHDHCVFCFIKFEKSTRPSQGRATLTEGYTTTNAHANGADYYWVCPTCVVDFAAELGWVISG
ncbi:hypothetical protein FNH05_08640 [Amycolatopsis rhizosphaerae]|uniref:Uncharacterized protein n=1 Tax=Amycolatopsis rhizosphaerae TaxID=2053003 RepID=A0A558D544_9PSEU|nr:hypothetical protein [Amycolatopsis rhizosphaerae]TVT56121.1 hypothetical protein FNH05_08640 [Amycolatopsis rhizosphaerae]